MSESFNGHKDWNHWNVALRLFNDEPNYRWMQHCVASTLTLDSAARLMVDQMQEKQTPDGAPYNFSTFRAAIDGWEE